MTELPFVHLRCHSDYSMLQGAATIHQLVDRAKELGMNALALTDSGNLHGALEFYRYAQSVGVKPILGYEAYVACSSRFDQQGNDHHSLTLLAKDRTGFQNLMQLATAAYLEGYHGYNCKPRIDKELLASHREGIICLSGGISGELGQQFLQDVPELQSLEAALELVAWFKKVFGDDYYIEIQDHGLPDERKVIKGAVAVADRMGVPLVVTNDVHYISRENAIAQDILMCIHQGKFLSDENRQRLGSDQYYLKSPIEMYKAFPGLEDAVQRSQQIADALDIELELGTSHFPVYKHAEPVSPEEYLRRLCLTGLAERYADDPEKCPDGLLAPVVLERLERELAVINKLGLSNYFLIVWDFVRFAREQNIQATARGSGVGSLVCYALYLSHVCPLKYDLLFERFLDESRPDAPDIDIDFCKERRAQVIQYVKDKYGEENVAQIGTFGTLAARAAIRDVGRAMSLPIPRVDAVAALVPDVLNIKLPDALKQSEELHRIYETDPEIRELLTLAMKIEGLARSVGTHAAAVVIADQPLTNFVPLCRVQGKDDIITQWAMGDVEEAGLLKIDFLGLRNLTILSKAVELIAETTGERIDHHRFPLDDAETFALLCRGETKGIFQLESGGIRDLLQKMKPDHFRDIIATNALYRPGPLEGGMVDDYVAVKHGRKEAVYPHPTIRDILEETHGVIVYQEQVMQILNRLGGIDLSTAYACIKAICKRKLPDIARHRQHFIQGSGAQGPSQSEAAALFDVIEKFAGYGFNKSHSAAYALVAYQTAYLKAHYPTQFMAALLTGDIPRRNFKIKDDLVENVEEAWRMRIKVVGPDINRSGIEFIVSREGGTRKIIFALSAIKSCTRAAAAIVEERERNGPFHSLLGFCQRVEPTAVNRSTIETLIRAGAFDSLGASRAAITRALWWLEVSGGGNQVNGPSNADIPECDEQVKLEHEKAVLGFNVSA